MQNSDNNSNNGSNNPNNEEYLGKKPTSTAKDIEIDTKLLQQLLQKHTPNMAYLLLHCVFALVVCIGLTSFYAHFYLPIPAEYSLQDEEDYRYSVAMGFGLLLTIIPWVVIIGRYIYLLSQVKTRAKKEYIELTLGK
ncbi:hypothetical protein [Flocculibacter collagenilyticus]|uniref:hypothetical protein n=1 Tax=Flocculibacter collagenilyticus TaxID=2744479 RepID=UPI0018F3A8D2|nr:hypothetical protein [Flocculibacter collagenilyticus]